MSGWIGKARSVALGTEKTIMQWDSTKLDS